MFHQCCYVYTSNMHSHTYRVSRLKQYVDFPTVGCSRKPSVHFNILINLSVHVLVIISFDEATVCHNMTSSRHNSIERPQMIRLNFE